MDSVTVNNGLIDSIDTTQVHKQLYFCDCDFFSFFKKEKYIKQV